MHWVPETSSNRSCYSLLQCNAKDNKAKETVDHRKEICREIKDCINANDDIDDMIVAEDFN